MNDVTDNKKLIEEAVEAVVLEARRQADASYDGPYVSTEEGLDSVVIDGRVDMLLLVSAALAVFEKGYTPTDDEIGMAAEIHTRYLRGEFDGESQKPGDAMRLAVLEGVRAGFRRSEVPEPSAEGYAVFEDWEQEMFRHQPVLSMADGSIAGCQCLDRVFVKGEDWGTHLATIMGWRVTCSSV